MPYELIRLRVDSRREPAVQTSDRSSDLDRSIELETERWVSAEDFETRVDEKTTLALDYFLPPTMGSGRSENVVFSRTTPTSLYVVSDPRFAHFCNTASGRLSPLRSP